MVRAMIGDCVAWKPERMPQAMVTKSIGRIGMLFSGVNIAALKAALSSSRAGLPIASYISTPKIARVPRISIAPKSG